MNPRQRHGVALLVLSVIGAGGVFFAVSSYTASVSRQLGPTRPVLTLTRDVPAYRALTPDDVTTQEVPRMYATQTQLADFREIGGLVPATRLLRGSRLEKDTLVEVPAAAAGEREITVNVGVEASVAAGLRPDDRVDVVAAYKGDSKKAPYARIMVSGARVLRVARLAETGAAPGVANSALKGDTELAVTFALRPKAVTQVVLAQTIADTVRLALRPRGVPVDAPRAPKPVRPPTPAASKGARS